MKPSLFQLSISAAAVIGTANLMAQEKETSNWPPKAYPLSRYESAWSRNPFDLKTAPPPAPAPKLPAGESFARNLVIAGITKVGDQETVILFDQQNSRHHRVTTSSGPDGLRLVSIRHDPDLRKVVARLAKGGEEAEVRYERRASSKGPNSRGTPRPEKGAGNSTSGRPGEPEAKPENGRQ